jgi:indolepyruvate ferredoxin oxidoreductase alpha subunit
MRKREYMLGNDAIARGIVEEGAQVISGYPGTPSSEIIGTLASMKERDFYVEWSVNEKVAFEVAAGAAMAGVRSVVTMKHVGLNVAADPMMTLAYTGIKGSMIIIVADDPSCHSSQNEQDTRRYSQFSLIPCLLCIRTVQQDTDACYFQTHHTHIPRKIRCHARDCN